MTMQFGGTRENGAKIDIRIYEGEPVDKDGKKFRVFSAEFDGEKIELSIDEALAEKQSFAPPFFNPVRRELGIVLLEHHKIKLNG